MKLLHIDSSINGAQSISRTLTRDIVSQWSANNPNTQVDYLDLAVDTPLHFSADSLGIRQPPGSHPQSNAQQQENTLSETLVSQFLDSDVVVIGAPLYNFSIPSQLKAWIDRIAQAGRTFRYTENGPIGLAGDKTAIIALSRGGVYSSSEAGQAMEHQESYLKTILGFFGVTDIRVVRAEGTNLGADALAAAMNTAATRIAEITAEPALAQSQAA
ncbi:FMN-dependent NADH-azoreductase [Allopusillimonas ginsengisoli]|uniref:FMN-dependent NADH-azoreductase n=1 Tax=Allopusillimonas ginsengisoli TaxID=453575 RepID=UPI001020D25F|nr:NAD(P)H-dependent oxidoreductase [Allopusillimonas ginsengisoli]TEA78077.1 FMN-dependent NADH-azoreductase [Allopusillimonas ginsengisoli]